MFAAPTEHIRGRWGHPLLTARAAALRLEPRLGGLFVAQWENGREVIASVTGWALDEHVRLSGPLYMGLAVGVATFDLAESGTGTLLQFSFRGLGVVDAAVAEATSRGWAELVGGMRPKPGAHVAMPPLGRLSHPGLQTRRATERSTRR